MKRKYNHQLYRVVKKTNSFARNRLSPNPTESLDGFGIIGKAIGFGVNKFLLFPIRALAYMITGMFYNKKRDTPYKGSFLYTVSYILLMFFTGGAITAIVRMVG